MITKETARQIYNCHQQIEEIGKIKSEMCEEVKKARERAEKDQRPIAENESSFGKYGKGYAIGRSRWYMFINAHFQHIARNCHSGNG